MTCQRDIEVVGPLMEIVEVGIVKVYGVLFSGLDKIPLSFTKKRIACDLWGAEASTEEASVLGTMKPVCFIL